MKKGHDKKAKAPTLTFGSTNVVVKRNWAKTIAKDGYSVLVTRGRPRKGTGLGATVTRSIRFPPQVWQRIEERAKEEKTPLHAALRSAVLAWVNEGGKTIP